MRLIRLLKRDLAQESREWVREGIITRDQAVRLCSRYDIDYDQSESKSIGYRVLVGLGIVFIGLSLITLIGANWDEIPRALRMWSLIALTAIVQCLGLLKYREHQVNAAIGLFLLGNILYGASIILIAQIYHLGEHMPDGIFWWALGSLPLALLIGSSWLTLFACLLGLIWFFLETNLGFYPALFPLFLLGPLFIVIRAKQNAVLFLLLIGSTGLWINYSLAFIWQTGYSLELYPEHIVVSVALFMMIYGLGHYLFSLQSNKAKDYGSLLGIWSLRFGLVFLLTMSFEGSWRFLLKEDWNHWLSMAIFSGVFLIVAVGLVSKSYRLLPLSGMIGLYVLSTVTVVVTNDYHYALYLQILTNIALVGMGTWLIVRGINSGISHYFYLGVTAILVTAFIRYLDLIGSYIGAALLFAFFSVLLLAAARYWKRQFKQGEPI